MTSVSSATSTYSYASQKSLFSKLDSDQDGKVTKDEFVSGRPENATETQAAKRYASIDTEGTGAITEDQLESAAPSMGIEALISSQAMNVLMLMSQQGGAMSFEAGSGSGGMPSISDLYAEMDADGDGSVTQSEFVSSRPEDMSEEQATSQFSSMDTEGTGSITEEQLAAGMVGAGSPPPGGTMGSGGATASGEVYDALDTNQDGVVSMEEFLAGTPDDVTEEQATSLFSAMDTEGTGSITREQFAEFMEAPPMPGMTEASSTDTDATSLDVPAFTDAADQILELLSTLESGETETA